MDNHVWLSNFCQSLEQKKYKLHPSDFRFYNIARLPILANKTMEFSSSCAVCKKNIQLLEELVDKLPESLDHKDTREIFEFNKNKIVLHLKKIHKHRLPAYYLSLFTLIGGIAGGVLGFLLSLIMISNSENLILISITIGLISGFITGKIKDKRKYQQNHQI